MDIIIWKCFQVKFFCEKDKIPQKKEQISLLF